MPDYKFHIGQSVYLRPAVAKNIPGGAYQITGHRAPTRTPTETLTNCKPKARRDAPPTTAPTRRRPRLLAGQPPKSA
jgi:hypothetical protein